MSMMTGGGQTADGDADAGTEDLGQVYQFFAKATTRLEVRVGEPADQRRSYVTALLSRSQVASVTPSSRRTRLSTRPTGLRGRSSRNSM